MQALEVTVIRVYRDSMIGITNINSAHEITSLHEVRYGVDRAIFEFDTYLVGVVVDRPAKWLATVDYGLTTSILFQDTEEIMDTGGPVIDNIDAAPADLGEQLFLNGRMVCVVVE